MCFNRFAPMNPVRFWNFQLLFVSLPAVFFYSYVTYLDGKQLKSKITLKEKPTVDYLSGENATIFANQRVKIAYILHVIMKIFFECLFLYFNFLLQARQSQVYDFGIFIFGKTWNVPEVFSCPADQNSSNKACINQKVVTCWVTKPYEKTMLLLYMVSLTYICIFVNLLEIILMVFNTVFSMLKKPTPNSDTVEFI